MAGPKRRKTMRQTCLYCGIGLIYWERSTRQFCSDNCRVKHWQRRQKAAELDFELLEEAWAAVGLSVKRRFVRAHERELGVTLIE